MKKLLVLPVIISLQIVSAQNVGKAIKEQQQQIDTQQKQIDELKKLAEKLLKP